MSLSESLNQVMRIKGVTSVAVMNDSGQLVESVPQSDLDEFVRGLVAGSLAVSRVLAELLGEGDVTQTMIEYERGPVLLAPLPLETGYTAILTLQDSQSLGRIRWRLRKLLPEIAEAVTAGASHDEAR